jgi:hypothetical protein
MVEQWWDSSVCKTLLSTAQQPQSARDSCGVTGNDYGVKSNGYSIKSNGDGVCVTLLSTAQ